MKIALIRAGIVENVITATMEFAQTLGYDATIDVTGLRVGTGYLWNGSAFAAPAPDPVAVNAAAIDSDLEQAIAQLRAFRSLAKPRTAAQRDNFDDQIATLAIRICRKLLQRFDSTD